MRESKTASFPRTTHTYAHTQTHTHTDTYTHTRRETQLFFHTVEEALDGIRYTLILFPMLCIMGNEGEREREREKGGRTRKRKRRRGTVRR